MMLLRTGNIREQIHGSPQIAIFHASGTAAGPAGYAAPKTRSHRPNNRRPQVDFPRGAVDARK